MKTCSHCKCEKSLDEFWYDKTKGKYCSRCKVCSSACIRTWKILNREKYLLSRRRWDEQNRWKDALYLSRPEVKDRNRERAITRYRNDPKTKINICFSTNMRQSLVNGKGGRKWESLVEYSISDLMRHLEKRFTDGMNWDNYGSAWHIDHIIPISAFNYTTYDDLDFKRCWNLRNLRPMYARENLAKSARIERPFQPSLAMAV